jgi:protocatechuate 3,4-dioxygenase beta subunit
MKSTGRPITRRRLLHGCLAAGAVCALGTRAFGAEELIGTPLLTEGPFYPSQLPLDTDNDLVVVSDGRTRAVGEITHLSGRILSASGEPMRNTLVEIWQVDGNGAYLHPGSANADRRDANFQGYGRFETDSRGRYRFRTVKPVPYPGRPAPHIHFAISRNGRRIYTTQMFVNGHPGNRLDGIFEEIEDPLARETVLVDFKPLDGSGARELAAEFEIVLGFTPPDLHHTKD